MKLGIPTLSSVTQLSKGTLPTRDLDKIPCSRKDQFYILVEDPNL